jgi:mono/diheme cytochrome c family protein
VYGLASAVWDFWSGSLCIYDPDHKRGRFLGVTLFEVTKNFNLQKMRKFIWMAAVLCATWACGSDSSTNKESTATAPAASAADAKPAYDSVRGSGKFTHVDIGPAIDQKLVASGKAIYDLKCSACHKLTSEKLVGPGWQGVTSRRKPEWIMNFVTNTDEMIDKDPNAQAMLQVCMVRMPNQHLSDDDARNILEFMRNNDQGK